MSVTQRYPTLPGNVPLNVTRYPPYRGNGNGNARGGLRGEKRYPPDGNAKADYLRRVEAAVVAFLARPPRPRPSGPWPSRRRVRGR